MGGQLKEQKGAVALKLVRSSFLVRLAAHVAKG